MFVPAVLVPVAMAGVFPHLLMTLALLDPSLAIVGWILLHRKADRSEHYAVNTT